MGRNSSGLHLEVAEWILARGDAACIYDVAKQFRRDRSPDYRAAFLCRDG